MPKQSKQPNPQKPFQNVDNTLLEKAVKEFAANQGKENMTKLLAAMHSARLFVPAAFPKGTDMRLLQNMAKDPQGRIPEGVKLLPALLKNKDGENFLPAFTDRKQIPQNVKYPAILCLPFVECRAMIERSNGEIKAMVVNPFSDNLVLNPAFMEVTKRAEQAGPVTGTVKMTVAQFHNMVRMQVERGVLPGMLAKESEETIRRLTEEREKFVYSLYEKAYETGSVANPYKPEDFSAMVLDLSDTMRYIMVKLPERNMAKGVCRAAYIAWNPEAKRYAYYLAEQGEGKEVSLLEFKGPKEIVNLGEAPREGEEIRRIMELFGE